MEGEKDLEKLLKTMKPSLNEGDYVFCVINDITTVESSDIIMFFREQEGFTSYNQERIGR